LLKKDVSVRFVRILQNWYSKLCAAIQWNGVIGNVFAIQCGYDKVEFYHLCCSVYIYILNSIGATFLIKYLVTCLKVNNA